jgi:hypothetical protein
MVVLVKLLLVDFTLAQAWRWEWPHLPRMLAATVCKDGGSLDGKFPRLLQLGDDPDEVEASWFHHPAKTDWKAAPDAASPPPQPRQEAHDSGPPPWTESREASEGRPD